MFWTRVFQKFSMVFEVILKPARKQLVMGGNLDWFSEILLNLLSWHNHFLGVVTLFRTPEFLPIQGGRFCSIVVNRNGPAKSKNFNILDPQKNQHKTLIPLGFSLLLVFGLSACSVVPSYGPSARAVVDGAEEAASENAFVLVPLDPTTLEKINTFKPRSFSSDFVAGFDEIGAMVIGVGDRLIVNVWEPSQDGVFATAEKKQTSLQTVVDEEGKVYIPYIGRIKAAGLKVEGLRKNIEEGLKGKAVDPQVQVLLEQNIANSVVVVGDVASPGQFPIPIRGLRLLEAIALAGGPREATYETIATVTRGKRSKTLRLEEVVNVSANNILLAAGDNILLIHKPRTYSAFGAVQTSGLEPFKTETVSLSEALAQVGGLKDLRANPGGVFLFRFEKKELAQWFVESGQGVGGLDAATPTAVPTVYRLDFRNPQAFFLAQSFQMQDKDVIYIANQPTAEFGKFLSIVVSPLLGVARTTTGLTE